MITITINGKIVTIQKSISVTQLLQDKEIDPDEVAVEINLTIIRKTVRKNYLINNGDVIEIIHLVGGG